MKYFWLIVLLMCSCVTSNRYQSIIDSIKKLHLKSIEDKGSEMPNKYSVEIYDILKKYCLDTNIQTSNKYTFPQKSDKIFYVNGLGFILEKNEWHQDKSGSYTIQYLSLLNKLDDKMILIGYGARLVN